MQDQGTTCAMFGKDLFPGLYHLLSFPLYGNGKEGEAEAEGKGEGEGRRERKKTENNNPIMESASL